MRPGTASSASPGRVNGLALSSSPAIVISLAMPGWPFAPEATLRTSGACVAAGYTGIRWPAGSGLAERRDATDFFRAAVSPPPTWMGG
ncbi:hypothetical protein, partial [Bradyrhizobium sp. PRIMUS42]|uniref:hypothetical protein n=1 Tax=Bradyrhizobium sp. PRIMUS42 TaxID=2908926 RepID=UPI001FF2CCED